MENYIIIAITASLVLSAFTFMACDYSKKLFIKYLPSFLIFISTIACLIKILFFSDGMLDLFYFTLFVINLLALICSLSTIVIFNIIKTLEKPKKSKKKKKKK
ncbi:MAG: hypothetical protein PHQ89_00960 [Bacilli bacterium]|nr:hypothetical protein [Bacilli bacterium]